VSFRAGAGCPVCLIEPEELHAGVGERWRKVFQGDQQAAAQE
jgi:hypothetical protein